MLIAKDSNAPQQVVAKVQELANALLPILGIAPLKCDGNFGSLTDVAIRAIQRGAGLVEDGVVGEQTLDVLQGKPVAPKKTYAPPKRGQVIKLELIDVISRATRVIGSPILYHLEYPNGGDNPSAGLPCDEHTGGLDCSGFNAWVHGFDRYQPGDFKYWDGYLNTDSKIAEAETEGKWFTIHETPEVGDMIVGETFRTAYGVRRIGHEGTVVDVSEWKTRRLAGIQVVHCSPRNYVFTDSKSAIWKTSGSIWTIYRKYRFLRFNRDYVLYLKAAKGKL